MADRPTPTTPPAGKPKKSGWRRFFTWFGITVLVLLLAVAAVIGLAYATVKSPDANADFQTNTSFVYYNDGKEKIGSYQIQNRQTLTYEQIPQYAKDAIVAGENRSFWTDPGISLAGMARAAISAVRGEEVVGGSTITQQYIKVLYLTQDKTLTRKFTEILLAAKMGNELSKEQILTGYLNTVYFGRGAYGIEAASQAYFGKPASELTQAQAIALTAIVNNPGNLDPAKGDKQAADLLERYQYTINGLVEMGKLTEAQKAEIYWKLPKFPKLERDSQFGGPKGFLLDMVQDELKAKGFTDEQIAGGGLTIITTFDADKQEAAVESAQKITLQTVNGNAKKARNLHAALVSIDVSSGGVLALYGGPDFVKNSRNWATTARPTGSTFKPYALGTAFTQGFTLSDIFNGSSFTPPGENVPVRNAGDVNWGPVTLQQATTHSINTAYVDLEGNMKNGPEETLAFAQDAGLPKAAGWVPISRVPLGVPEVSPLSQANGYATFANEGKHIPAHVVATVQDSSGATLYKSDALPDQTVPKDVANDVAFALTQVVNDDRRPGRFDGLPDRGQDRHVLHPRCGGGLQDHRLLVRRHEQADRHRRDVRGGRRGNRRSGRLLPGLLRLRSAAEHLDVLHDGGPGGAQGHSVRRAHRSGVLPHPDGATAHADPVQHPEADADGADADEADAADHPTEHQADGRTDPETHREANGDGHAMTATRALGGDVGRRAQREGIWFNPQPWVLLAGTVSYLVLMLRQLPCQLGGSVYKAMCYSDIGPLFYSRKLAEGKVPFISADVEYPVLTGAIMDLARRITLALGGQTGPDLPYSVAAHAAAIFVGVNAVLLFGFFLLLLWAHLHCTARGTP